MNYKRRLFSENINVFENKLNSSQFLEILRFRLNKKTNNYIFIFCRIIFNRLYLLIKIFLINLPGNYTLHKLYDPFFGKNKYDEIPKYNLKRFFSHKSNYKVVLDKYERTIEFKGTIYKLNNSYIDTNTSLIQIEREVFKTPFTLNEQLTHAEYFRKVKYLGNQIQIIKSRKKKIYFDDAYVIVCECSSNWSHFLLEIFTTLIEYISSNRIKNSTFLITGIPHENGIKLINNFLNYLDPHKTNKFYFLDSNFLVYVKRLIYIDSCCYIPYGFRKKFIDIKELLYFDRVRLSKAKKIVDDFISSNDLYRKKRKIYLERKGNFRNAINKKSLRNCLRNLGFEIINPESLTLEEQCKIFPNCSHLVSTSGAALSNMIFMEVGSKVTVIMAKSEYVSYGHWQSQAFCYGLNLNYCLGNMPKDQLTEIHPSFYIDLKLVEKKINE